MIAQGLFRHLPVETFTTGTDRYVLDAGKAVFLSVDDVSYSLLRILRRRDLPQAELLRRLPQFKKTDVVRAVEDIRKLQRRGYLRPNSFRRKKRFTRSKIEEVLRHHVSGISLNITTRCNLACSYCIYGGSYGRYRKLDDATMSWETAKNALDFLIRNSDRSDRIRLDFFGGEPLLAFKLIERCVGYLKAGVSSRGTQVLASIASNGTVLTDDILRFLRAEKVYLQFSLDGGRDVHDRKRPYKSSGAGSYRRIIRNLERIHEADSEYFKEYMRIKSVITLDGLEIEDVFFEHPLLFELHDRGQTAIVFKETHYAPGEDSEYFAQLGRIRRNLLSRRGIRTLEDLRSPLTARERALFDISFAQFLEVQSVNTLYFGSSAAVPFTKSCLPGSGDASVEPDGKILVCHKATSFVIGDVNEGRWDLETIWGIYTNLNDDWPDCGSCFVQRFCDLCFEKLDRKDITGSRRDFCTFTRKKYRIIFDTMLRVLDRNPDLWDDFRASVTSGIKAKIDEALPGE